jgi:hypothetical protein
MLPIAGILYMVCNKRCVCRYAVGKNPIAATAFARVFTGNVENDPGNRTLLTAAVWSVFKSCAALVQFA